MENRGFHTGGANQLEMVEEVRGANLLFGQFFQKIMKTKGGGGGGNGASEF